MYDRVESRAGVVEDFRRYWKAKERDRDKRRDNTGCYGINKVPINKEQHVRLALYADDRNKQLSLFD